MPALPPPRLSNDNRCGTLHKGIGGSDRHQSGRFWHKLAFARGWESVRHCTLLTFNVWILPPKGEPHVPQCGSPCVISRCSVLRDGAETPGIPTRPSLGRRVLRSRSPC